VYLDRVHQRAFSIPESLLLNFNFYAAVYIAYRPSCIDCSMTDGIFISQHIALPSVCAICCYKLASTTSTAIILYQQA
jgi:hypothetical protein